MTTEQAACARTVESEHIYITNESVMDGNSSNYSFMQRKLITKDILKVRDHKQFLPIMSTSDQRLELKYSNLQELLVIEVQVQSKQPGNSKSWVRISREVQPHTRQVIPTETNHQQLKPRHHSSQSAAGDREHRKPLHIRQSDIKVRQSQSLYQMVSVNETRRDCEFVDISRHFKKILRIQGVMNPMEQYGVCGIMC